MNRDSVFFHRLPTPEECRDYFVALLSRGPQNPAVYLLFLRMGIEGIADIKPIDSPDKNIYRVLATSDYTLITHNPKTEKHVIETYLVDFDFGPASLLGPDDGMKDIPFDKRIRFWFDPSDIDEPKDFIYEEGVCGYHLDCVFGLERMADILSFFEDDPIDAEFESLIRYLAVEIKKDPSECFGESAVAFAKFVNEELLKHIRKELGSYAHAHAYLLDLQTARAAFVLLQDVALNEAFGGDPLNVDVIVEFDYSPDKIAVTPSLFIDYSDFGVPPGSAVHIKNTDIGRFFQKAFLDVPSLHVVGPIRWDEHIPFAIADPIPSILDSKQAREDFLIYLFDLFKEVVEVIKKAEKELLSNKGE